MMFGGNNIVSNYLYVYYVQLVCAVYFGCNTNDHK